jgi:transposase
MKDAWIYKEWFCEALDELCIEDIRRIRNECLESEHYRIKDFGMMLKRWDKQLEAFCTHSTEEFKFTNAFTEGMNNQCKVAKRVSHGFKYKSNYKRKISARFSNQN